MAGLLNTSDGKLLNLNNIGNTPLAEKIKSKACDLVLNKVLFPDKCPLSKGRLIGPYIFSVASAKMRSQHLPAFYRFQGRR
ncbi:hypothetical protein BIY28_09515 [Brenneria goodwinii]|nr:hypothetical protein BIY28_09515 [Brenneria goodwinii]